MSHLARKYSFILVGLMAILALTVGTGRADSLDGFVVKDPHYGEVLFHFYQQDQFTALTHLVTARSQSRLAHHQDDAELLEGGLLLSWGQHEEAGKIFERLLATSTNPSVRNRTWFYLAKVRYQRGHLEAAQRAFESISEPLPPELEAERYNLQARLYIDKGRYAEAVALLTNWQGDQTWTAYANYNIGVALVRMGQLDMGASLLNRVGTVPAADEEMRSLRDQANVALGFSFLQAQLDGDARPVLQRVRLNGPFSNKALLGVGWADSAGAQYQSALAAWLELSERDLLDSAVQESLLAVPYAYAQLGADPQAAAYYAQALDIFGAQLLRLDAALEDVGNGRLLGSLLKGESESTGGWYWQLDKVPDDERTRYLYFAIADHRFHEGLKSYRELVALNKHLADWREKLGAYRDMLATRELAYAQRLPTLQDSLAQFDLPAMQARHDVNTRRTKQARATRNIVDVAPAREQEQWRRLIQMESAPAWDSQAATGLQDKQRILKGVLLWEMDKEFRVRLWRQEKANKELGEELRRASEQFASIETAMASIPATVSGFENRIKGLETSIAGQQSRLEDSMAQYARYLNGIATDELRAQRERVRTYSAQARFALASIYDRMAAQNR
jgi:tetratricopeptide (TPR) repeat protein